MTHSFPTRRASDLAGAAAARLLRAGQLLPHLPARADPRHRPCQAARARSFERLRLAGLRPRGTRRRTRRSEEHTSELPSLMRTSSAVFCLKKKIMTIVTQGLSPLSDQYCFY